MGWKITWKVDPTKNYSWGEDVTYVSGHQENKPNEEMKINLLITLCSLRSQ